MGVNVSSNSTKTNYIAKEVSNIIQNQINQNTQINNFVNSLNVSAGGNLTITGSSITQTNKANLTCLIISTQNNNIAISQSDQSDLDTAIQNEITQNYNVAQDQSETLQQNIKNSIISNNQFNNTFVSTITTNISNTTKLSATGNVDMSNVTILQQNDAVILEQSIQTLIQQVASSSQISCQVKNDQSSSGSDIVTYVIAIILIIVGVSMLYFYQII